jgi:hypothetical protein
LTPRSASHAREAYDNTIQLGPNLQLAKQPRIGCSLILNQLEHCIFGIIHRWQEIEKGRIDMAVASRAGAYSATIGINPFNAISHGDFHGAFARICRCLAPRHDR